MALRRTLSVDDYVAGIVAGDRTVLARAITLVESTRPADHITAQAVLAAVLPRTGQARRVGITGVPGVGKSTFIEAIGTRLTAAGHTVAVLAVDPSSSVSGGSILGDKTRMNRLAIEPNAFIRPSPSAGTLGGVGRRTREAMLLCEATGFDTILVETVGVGQSETVVAGMVDCFLVLMLPGAGDELQGIKKGILELADALVVNKADGDRQLAARRAAREYSAALHYIAEHGAGWKVPVLLASSTTGEGLDAVWDAVLQHRAHLAATGELERVRATQRQTWMWSMVHDALVAELRAHPAARQTAREVEAQVRDGVLPAASAAAQILAAFGLGAARVYTD